MIQHLKHWLGYLLALLLALALGLEQAIEAYESSRLQARIQSIAPTDPDPQILIVGIDEAVFQSGRFNRKEHANLVTTLTRAGAREIFLDLIFDEERGPEFDPPLARAIQESGRVILAGHYRREDAQSIFVPAIPILDKVVRSGKARYGIINTARQGDKTTSAVAVVDRSTQPPRVELSAAAAMLAETYHLPPQAVEAPPPTWFHGSLLQIPPAQFELQAKDEGLQVLVSPFNYHPPATGPYGKPNEPGRLTVLPYLKVADGDPETLQKIQGKYVFVGENTHSENDLFDTPVGQIKGIEIHAQLFDALLRNRVPHIALPGTTMFHLSRLLALLAALLLARLCRYQTNLWRLTLVVLTFLILWHEVVVLGDMYGYFLNETLGLACLGLTTGLVLFFRFLASARVLRTFIPATIVDQLLRSEEIVQGEVEATVMVTDIRGYTTLSESRTPTEVLHLLNDYHTETVALYQKFGGNVLNYQGDAQIILFGHPKILKDAPRQAILAAQAASSAVETLRKRWQLPAGQQFNVGAGIGTGKVIIADLGGEHREYTVIGELVRKCHKLQSQSQILGANIILDEETYQRCLVKPEVEKRENVVIEGLPEPVTVYITDLIPSE